MEDRLCRRWFDERGSARAKAMKLAAGALCGICIVPDDAENSASATVNRLPNLKLAGRNRSKIFSVSYGMNEAFCAQSSWT